MQLPHRTAAYSHRVVFSTYVERRLRREGATTPAFMSLADKVQKSRNELLSQGRAWEDAALPIQEGLADRDAADDALDSFAQQVRFDLAGRALNATQTTPYTQIFPDSLKYYTSATLDEQVARYTELKTRLTTYLPAGDAVLTMVPILDALLSAWTSACASLDQSRTQESMARDQLDAKTSGWETLMQQVYGELVAALGKKGAEAYFP